MPDEPSTSDDKKEPLRLKTTPDDFIWDPETQSWYPPGEASNFSEYWPGFLKRLDEEFGDDDTEEGPHLISRDELLAAGALNVRAVRPKPPRRVNRDQLSLFGDDNTVPTKAERTPSDSDGNEPSEELP